MGIDVPAAVTTRNRCGVVYSCETAGSAIFLLVLQCVDGALGNYAWLGRLRVPGMLVASDNGSQRGGAQVA